MLPPGSAEAQITRLIREDWGRILASLVSSIGDYTLAEDSLQDAVVEALGRWANTGLPNAPDAWLITVARRKALDRLRRSETAARKAPDLVLWLEGLADTAEDAPMLIPDHRLELIFTCCHPALEEKSRVALTLRALGGLTTEEIASAFVDTPAAMAARLTRAKKKLRAAGVPFKLPEVEDLHTRLDGVLKVIYLVFNEGCHASSGALSRADLVAEAIRLGRILKSLLPDHAEITGLLALMLLTDSRRLARTDDAGHFVALEDQNRARWDRAKITEGAALVEQALTTGPPGPYALQAAISALHAQAPSFAATDWPQIVALYGELARLDPNPIIRVNQAVALSYADSPEPALALLDAVAVSQDLGRYQPLHASRADLLARLARHAEAAESYRAAIALARAPEQVDFLTRRLNALGTP